MSNLRNIAAIVRYISAYARLYATVRPPLYLFQQRSIEIHVLDSKAESGPLAEVDKIMIERRVSKPAFWVKALWFGEDSRVHDYKVDDFADCSLIQGNQCFRSAYT